MIEVFLITARFPYYPGEPFLEEELKFWRKEREINLNLLPLKNTGEIGCISSKVRVLNDLENCILYKEDIKTFKVVKLPKIFLKKHFWREMFCNFSKLFSLEAIFRLIRTAYSIFEIEKRLFSLLSNINNEIIIYSYWFDAATYAGALCRKKLPDKNIRVITRAHGYDLYNYLYKNRYMPFQKKFISEIDRIYPVSNVGKIFLLDNYDHLNRDNIRTSFLGVQDYGMVSKISAIGVLNVLSCSRVIKLKQVDKSISGLSYFASKNKMINIYWTHIGDGELLNDMIGIAQKESFKNPNFTFNFLGQITKEEVNKFFKTQEIDCLINTSKSEGIPVTMMEALSFGVPIIGPDVGGVKEIISSQVGILLPQKFSDIDLSSALGKILEFKTNEKRVLIKGIWGEKFTNINYYSFIQDVIN